MRHCNIRAAARLYQTFAEEEASAAEESRKESKEEEDYNEKGRQEWRSSKKDVCASRRRGIEKEGGPAGWHPAYRALPF